MINSFSRQSVVLKKTLFSRGSHTIGEYCRLLSWTWTMVLRVLERVLTLCSCVTSTRKSLFKYRCFALCQRPRSSVWAVQLMLICPRRQLSSGRPEGVIRCARSCHGFTMVQILGIRPNDASVKPCRIVLLEGFTVKAYRHDRLDRNRRCAGEAKGSYRSTNMPGAC